MSSYSVEIAEQADGVVTLRLAFGEPAHNDRIVRDAADAITALNLSGGKGVRLNGPCSVPAAIAIGHALSHRFGYVAAWDPKLGRYVVCVSHDPAVRVGDFIG